MGEALYSQLSEFEIWLEQEGHLKSPAEINADSRVAEISNKVT